MSGFIKQTYIALVLAMLGIGKPLATKCVSMNERPCMVGPTVIVLNSDELHYYTLFISLGWCVRSCNAVEDPFDRICVSNKIKDVNLKVLDMTEGANESKTLIK